MADNPQPNAHEAASLEPFGDVELDLKIELGRTQMYLEDVLKLGKGSVVPLDRLAGDPVDIIAGGQLIARGEVLVLDEKFCVRVTELITGRRAA
jgi:flagellar motor switch protein FliN/FliY